MSVPREIRDPIYGFIERSETEEKLINTRVFQRLRRIKQLALANLVYPGASHTRFEHSLGVMHIAGKLAQQLSFSREDAELVRIAGLLHDIGHGPFSHVSENLLDKYYDTSKMKLTSKEKIHEYVTCGIIKNNEEIVRILGQDKCEKISDLLLGKTGSSIVKGVISGPLDADKQDYLLRDSYFCGVKYGIFDSDRLIITLCERQDKHDKLLAATSDGIYAIEQFVLAKYHMTTQVYRHKIRLITDQMIIRALELGINNDNLEWLKKLYSYDGSNEFLKNYLEFDDARLITGLLYPLGNGGVATDMFWRLTERRLFKVVFSSRLMIFSDVTARDYISKSFDKNQFRRKVEQKVAEYLSQAMGTTILAHQVIFVTFSIKSVREQSRDNEGSILIIKADSSNPGKFEDESSLFRSINEKESDQFVEVYAPVTFKDDVDKKKKREEFYKDIPGMIEKEALDFINKGG